MVLNNGVPTYIMDQYNPSKLSRIFHFIQDDQYEYFIILDYTDKKVKYNSQLSIELLEDEESHQNCLKDIQTIAMQHPLLAKYFSKEINSNLFHHKIIERAKILIEMNREVGDENVH